MLFCWPVFVGLARPPRRGLSHARSIAKRMAAQRLRQNPCGHCESCRAISEDRSVDVLEIDAASHTGVDNIRELLDGVRYGAGFPHATKFYIIDEVHMLSKGAFNALLKTLEEPPAHCEVSLRDHRSGPRPDYGAQPVPAF